MAHAQEARAPLIVALCVFCSMTAVTIANHISEFLSNYIFRKRFQKKREGYALLLGAKEDFYNRRMFGRLQDCWNRPICSAPDSWITVMEREDIERTAGKNGGRIELTGNTTNVLNLGSYNYLGFAASDAYCTPRVHDTIDTLGISMCSPAAGAGCTDVMLELEAQVARYVGREAAMVCGMGFATNSFTIPALVGKGCLILSDALNHSSIVAGARATGAKIKVFRHNDPGHLEELLRESIAEGQPRSHRPWKKILIIVEGIYSMEGDICNLKEMVEVKKKYKAYLYLDEAHSIGAIGRTGRGACEHCGVDPKDVDICMGTFTKSFGSSGGYIAGSRELIQHLRRHCPSYLYSASMAPGAAQQTLSALKLLMGEDTNGGTRGQEKVRALHANANYFRRRLIEMGMDVLGDWDSPVMPFMVYSPLAIGMVSRMCLRMGVAVVVVAFPATPLLLARVRVCISAAHNRADLDYALKVLREVGEVTNIRLHKPCTIQIPAPYYEHEDGTSNNAKAASSDSAKDARRTSDTTTRANGKRKGGAAGGAAGVVDVAIKVNGKLVDQTAKKKGTVGGPASATVSALVNVKANGHNSVKLSV